MTNYLVVGAGLSGATAARLLTDAGHPVQVFEKNPHVGGNCHTTVRDGVVIHEHGPHIFHTSNADVIDFVKRFANWIPYRHKVMAVMHTSSSQSPVENIAPMPINLLTMHLAMGFTLCSVGVMKEALEAYGMGRYPTPQNFREEAVNKVGYHIYERLIRHYTEKQWGAKCGDLPTGIISRIPVRFNYDDNYFFDDFQAVPEGGYTRFIEKMLEGINVTTGVHIHRVAPNEFAKVIYTGKIDELHDYCFGELPYRSLDITHELSAVDYGVAQLNDCTPTARHTRTTTHKHLGQDANLPNWISREYPKQYKRGDIPYYPINNETNNALWRKYRNLTREKYPHILLLGRLAEYKYFDMDKAIHSAMNLVEKELKNGAR